MDSITKQYSSNIWQMIQDKPILDAHSVDAWVDVDEDDFEDLLQEYYEARLNAEEHGEKGNN